ncbi:MAG: hypothetical protein VYA68_00100 [Pseudomonadota bacterium]|nr:hypothetical protein [Pseudomonadota bacterium]
MTFSTFFLAPRRRPAIIATILTAALLGGCSWLENLVLAGDTDTGKIERVTRDLLASETLRQEQVGTRLETIQRQMGDRLQALEAEAVTTTAALKQRIADLTERLAAADRRARTAAAAAAPELDGLKARHTQLAARVDDLVTRRRHHDGRLNARLERLELRTSAVKFPPADGAIGIHLASYRAFDDAIAGWDLLSRKYGADLIAFTPEYLAVETVGGRFVRLMIGLGRPRADLVPVVARLRASGDYAMIMPVPRDAVRVKAAPAS